MFQKNNWRDTGEDGWEVGQARWSQEDELGSHRFNPGCGDLGSDVGGRREKEQI